MLTSEQIMHFEIFGFLVVENLFSSNEMDIITSIFEKNMLEDRNGRSFDGEERQSIFGMVERNPELVDLVVDTRIYDSIAQILGPGFIWTASDGNFWVGDTQWHPDRHDRIWPLIKVAMYLDPVTKDTGCLRVIPGSHKMPFHSDLMPLEKWRTEKNNNADEMLSNSNNSNDVSFGLEGKDVPCVPLETTPGDLIFFHQNLFHASFGGHAGRRQLALSYGANPKTKEQMVQVRQMYNANLAGARERKNIEGDRLYGDVLMDNDNPRIKTVAERLVELGLK